MAELRGRQACQQGAWGLSLLVGAPASCDPSLLFYHCFHFVRERKDSGKSPGDLKEGRLIREEPGQWVGEGGGQNAGAKDSTKNKEVRACISGSEGEAGRQADGLSYRSHTRTRVPRWQCP